MEDMETLNREVGADNAISSELVCDTADIYRELAHWAEAEELFAQVLKRKTYLFGTENSLTLSSMANMSSFSMNYKVN